MIFYAFSIIVGAIVFLLLLAVYHTAFKTAKQNIARINIIGPMIVGGVFGVILVVLGEFRLGLQVIASGLLAGLISIKMRDMHL
ncbi:MAG: hypothetical protein HN757_05410 [Calditrichaeota bacterium]|nr:hypothetical protein [Calditrichota bacterium]